MRLRLSGALASALFAASCLAPTRPPQPPKPPPPASSQLCIDIWQQELGRRIDDDGLRGCLAQQVAGRNGDQIRATVKASPEWAEFHKPKPPAPPAAALPPLHADGKIFRLPDGTPWRYKGVSSFALLDRFAKGQDISDVLTAPAYQGFNTVRVWEYVPVKDWKASAWDVRSADVTRAFVARVALAGWRVELTLLTDDDPARLAWAKAFVPQLTAGGCPSNLFLEGGNEPRTHKAIDTAALKGVLQASGCLYASGDYEDSNRAYGTYLVTHTARDGEWPRRTHDCYDFFKGGGPNDPSDPAHRVPCVLDEPAKPADVGGNHMIDWAGYFGSAGILAAGATSHNESGKFGLPPTPEEAQLAGIALKALDAFPADAPLGGYACLTCPGGGAIGDSLRTYLVGGKYMVRIRPKTPASPRAGFTPIDTAGILWRQ